MSEGTEKIIGLNDIPISILNSKNLKAVIKDLIADRLDCDDRCNCKYDNCECRGHVSKESIFEDLSLPEFNKLREKRIAELQSRLRQLQEN